MYIQISRIREKLVQTWFIVNIGAASSLVDLKSPIAIAGDFDYLTKPELGKPKLPPIVVGNGNHRALMVLATSSSIPDDAIVGQFKDGTPLTAGQLRYSYDNGNLYSGQAFLSDPESPGFESRKAGNFINNPFDPMSLRPGADPITVYPYGELDRDKNLMHFSDMWGDESNGKRAQQAKNFIQRNPKSPIPSIVRCAAGPLVAPLLGLLVRSICKKAKLTTKTILQTHQLVASSCMV